MAAFKQINFGPLAHNILDFVGRGHLETVDGKKVTIEREGIQDTFVLTIGQTRLTTRDNIEASHLLNQAQIGVRR